jgi:hypothetical protein
MLSMIIGDLNIIDIATGDHWQLIYNAFNDHWRSQHHRRCHRRSLATGPMISSATNGRFTMIIGIANGDAALAAAMPRWHGAERRRCAGRRPRGDSAASDHGSGIPR